MENFLIILETLHFQQSSLPDVSLSSRFPWYAQSVGGVYILLTIFHSIIRKFKVRLLFGPKFSKFLRSLFARYVLKHSRLGKIRTNNTTKDFFCFSSKLLKKLFLGSCISRIVTCTKIIIRYN